MFTMMTAGYEGHRAIRDLAQRWCIAEKRLDALKYGLAKFRSQPVRASYYRSARNAVGHYLDGIDVIAEGVCRATGVPKFNPLDHTASDKVKKWRK